MPDISLVIVNWNTRDLLLDCIRTVLESTLAYSVELIVVDNGSSDGSVDAARRLDRVTVISNPRNVGFAAANNIGIRASRGRYICLVNSDVQVLAGCLDGMCRYMDINQEVGVLGPRILNKDLSLQRSCAELPSLWNILTQALILDQLFPRVRWLRSRLMKDFDHTSARNVEVLSGCFLMARRTALEEVGVLDERFFIYKEDVDWCKRFGDAGWSVRFYPNASAIHLGGATSSVAPARFLIEMEKSNIQYWRKYHAAATCVGVGLVTLIHYGVRIGVWGMLHLFRRQERIISKEMILRYWACVCWLLSRGMAVKLVKGDESSYAVPS